MQDFVDHGRVYEFYFYITGKPLMEGQNCERSGPSVVISVREGHGLGWHERHREANRLVICFDTKCRLLSMEWM